MGILEIHFHDLEFEWTFGSGGGEKRSFSVGTGDESGGDESDDASRPPVGPKLRSAGLVALAVGAAVVLGRLRARRARTAADSGGDSSTGHRLSLSRSQ